MPDIQIRAAEPEDAAAVQEIFNGPNVVANTMQLPWRSLDWRRDWLNRMRADGNLLVAVVDGRVVGNIGLHLETTPRRRHVASFGMSVHQDYQNQGVGSALMRAMLELADWAGVHRIELEVYTDNPAAVHLYKKFGFEIEGTARDYARRAGGYVDAYRMARLFTP